MMATKTELWAGPLDGLEVQVPSAVWEERDDIPKILIMHHVYVYQYDTLRFEYGWSV